MSTVDTVMHRGLISCRAEAPLVAVARTMAAHRIHCVVVPNHGIVTDLELATALDGSAATAADIARAAPTLDENDSLERAAAVLHQSASTHALVCDHSTGRVTGLLSALDLADAYSAR